MNSSILFDSLTDKARKLFDSANAIGCRNQYGPVVRAGLIVSAAALSVRAVNRFLNDRALNHGTKASFDWSQEIVIVTGGSGGIGGETVKRLAAAGTTVVVLDILPLSFQKPSNVHYYQCDLTSFEELKAVATKLRIEVGEPTIIVANAGICRGKSILNAEERDIELTFGVNTLGLLWTAKSFLPSLASHNHGHFLIVASQTSYLATAGATDYCASKAAALAIYEGLHSEVKHVYKSSAVRVSCVCPSHVQTAMLNGIKNVPGMASITAQTLAATIESILKSGRAHNLTVPSSVGISTLIRALPDWIRVLVQDLSATAFSSLKPRDEVAKRSKSSGM